MIFISYSQKDYQWRERFLTMAAPLKRYLDIEFWSDKNIQAGKDWNNEIQDAMRRARIAVLLVSDNFLASDFIADQELPFFLAEAKKNKVTILWLLLTPCLWHKTGLRKLEACCVNKLRPLLEMSECGWRQELCNLVLKIDEIECKAETPVINSALNGRSLPHIARNLQLLAKPAIRETEVLVYSGDGKWYTQARIPKCQMTTTCYFGNADSKRGSTYKVIAITTEDRLDSKTKHLNIPAHRSKSAEISVTRA